jgi:cadmium resistance protein CadD (predicted permease)
VVAVDIISLIGIGAAAYAATDIDDIVVLMVFFSSSNFQARNVVIGQYLGIGSLVAISALGSLLALVIPSYIIGLMGLVPIAIGIKELLELWNNKNKLKEEEEKQVSKKKLMLRSEKKKGSHHHLSFLAVAAVTISNGGDNIGIYIPLFASYNSSLEVLMLVSVFMAMTAVWCAIGYYLVRHPLLERRMRHFGHIVLPFVLIGLGIYILSDAFLFSSSFAIVEAYSP